MDGKRAAPRKGRRVVFAGIRFLCRAGPMCPAAGYAFFGGAHGPRPTGRYVEPRVGDGVPSARRCRAVIARSVATRQFVFLFWGDGFPRQCAHWLGMTALRADTSLSEGGEGETDSHASDGGAHGPRPTGCGGHTGRTESSAPTSVYRGFPGGTANGGEKCLHLRR